MGNYQYTTGPRIEEPESPTEHGCQALLFFIFRTLISTFMSIEDNKMQFPAKNKNKN
jgi:hypothetical protein